MVRREGLVPARNAGMSVGDEYRDRQLDLTATNLAIVEDRVHDLLPNRVECNLLFLRVLRDAIKVCQGHNASDTGSLS